jgi:hypothetical protein
MLWTGTLQRVKGEYLAKTIIYPVSNAVKRERLRNLIIDSICEYMDADITTKTIAVLEVTYPEERKDIEMLLQAIYNNIVKKNNCGG